MYVWKFAVFVEPCSNVILLLMFLIDSVFFNSLVKSVVHHKYINKFDSLLMFLFAIVDIHTFIHSFIIKLFCLMTVSVCHTTMTYDLSNELFCTGFWNWQQQNNKYKSKYIFNVKICHRAKRSFNFSRDVNATFIFKFCQRLVSNLRYLEWLIADDNASTFEYSNIRLLKKPGFHAI